jgi:hypothetical protein
MFQCIRFYSDGFSECSLVFASSRRDDSGGWWDARCATAVILCLSDIMDLIYCKYLDKIILYPCLLYISVDYDG